MAASVVVSACASEDPAPKASNTGKSSDGRLNVLLITIDTLRADALGCYGSAAPTSPNLDAFAASSTRFANAFSTAGNTPPAMAALMIGRFPYFSRDESMRAFGSGMSRFFESEVRPGLPPRERTLAERLKDAGYSTAGFVTNAHLSKSANFDRGFNSYRLMMAGPPSPTPYQPAENVVRSAQEWLDSRTEEPFFLFLHFNDPHYPYLPPPEYRERAGVKRVQGLTDVALQKIWHDERDLDSWVKRGIAEHARGLYDAEIMYLDAQLGVLFRDLESRGLLESTLVVITADHGEEFLEHGHTVHKNRLYDEHLRVPLILRIPGRRGSVEELPVRNFDAMPTILDYCGLTWNREALDAKSLRPVLEGDADSSVRPVFASYPEREYVHTPVQPPQRTFRNADWKLIWNLEAPETSELYHTFEDPGEQYNRISGVREMAEKLHAEMSAAVLTKLEAESEFGATDSRIVSDEEILDELGEGEEENLRALGYLE